MGLECEGVEYFYKALCFGLNVGPRIFTKTLKKVIQFFRRVFQICVSFYLDDLIAQSLDPQQLKTQSQAMILVLHLLGFRVNLGKSDLIPSQKITHLGFELDTIEMTVALLVAKVQMVVGKVTSIIECGSICQTDADPHGFVRVYKNSCQDSSPSL